jgi:cell fate regulator YaaT (PSP1 superfamily)
MNNSGIPLVKGDIVAVEASPGHDVGVVSLVGELVPIQMKRYGISGNLKKIYRKAKPNDIEKWYQSIEKEQETMRIARQIASDLKIAMKISDVEYQGDKTKATFYYLSDDRVDFRNLIKQYADLFKVRIEMKQIGSRQEAGKVGGVGTCGRELCCASWISSFASVSTSAARYQEISLNPQKLAGQCGKLKCCLNYELKSYLDAQGDFPNTSVPLETEHGKAYHNKTDVFRRVMWYVYQKDDGGTDFVPLDVDVVKEIIRLNREGVKVQNLVASENTGAPLKEPAIGYQNSVGEGSISRFEEKRRRKKKKPDNRNTRPEQHDRNGDKSVDRPQPGSRQDEVKARKNRNRNKQNRNRNGSAGMSDKTFGQSTTS